MSIPSLCQVVTCAVLVHLTVLVSSTYFTILGIEGIRADKYFISQHCSFLLNFVLKKLTDHLDCDHALKEKVMKSAMEHRNLAFDKTCTFEKTFLPRIYLEAKRRLKQTPSMHMKKHKSY